MDEAGPRHNQLRSPRYLCVPNGGDFQRKLRAFVLLSDDQGDLQSGSCPPDLRVVVRKGDIELPD